jgi:metal-responsive CopG/Arc/MetJ family transcriptional regulator
MSEMVHLRVPDKLYETVEEVVDQMGFRSVQEFIRQAIRDQLFEYEKKMAILWLEKEKGSLKGKIKRLTEEERRALAEEFVKGDNSELLRKYGFDKE